MGFGLKQRTQACLPVCEYASFHFNAKGFVMRRRCSLFLQAFCTRRPVEIGQVWSGMNPYISSWLKKGKREEAWVSLLERSKKRAMGWRKETGVFGGFSSSRKHSQVMRLWIFLERWNGALAWLSFLVFNLVVVRCLLWSRLCVAYWLSKISPRHNS